MRNNYTGNSKVTEVLSSLRPKDIILSLGELFRVFSDGLSPNQRFDLALDWAMIFFVVIALSRDLGTYHNLLKPLILVCAIIFIFWSFLTNNKINDRIEASGSYDGSQQEPARDSPLRAQGRNVTFVQVRGSSSKELQVAAPQALEHIFVSYSHADTKWLKRLQTALKPLVRSHQLSLWDDTQIKAGDKWRDEISHALRSAKAAIFLVSQSFMASDFITFNELPPLLKAADECGVRIFWIAISASLYEESPLSAYQSLNDPTQPLDSLPLARRNKELVRIAGQIRDVLK